MRSIGKNEELINELSGELNLTSCKIYKIDIYMLGENLLIEVYIKLLYSKSEDNIKLRFSQVKEYSFIYNSDYTFYNVEIYKFFKVENDVYISFDPIDEDENVSNSDQDYILSKNVEGFFISKSEGI